MTCGIYMIYNIVNEKVYIGQSGNMEYRLRKHKEALKGDYHKNDHLQKAFNKYGEHNFFFSPILQCDDSKRDYFEIKYIEDFKSTDRRYGYNIALGGHKHKHMAEETKTKLSNALKGRITNPKNHARLIKTQKKEKHPNWIKEFSIEDAVIDYNNGLTLDEIANKHDICSRTVWVRLKHSGIELTHNKGLRNHKNYDIDGIITDFKNGMSRRKLATKYGHARNTITKILKNEGVIA